MPDNVDLAHLWGNTFYVHRLRVFIFRAKSLIGKRVMGIFFRKKRARWIFFHQNENKGYFSQKKSEGDFLSSKIEGYMMQSVISIMGKEQLWIQLDHLVLIQDYT